jgi:hypothetical protein
MGSDDPLQQKGEYGVCGAARPDASTWFLHPSPYDYLLQGGMQQDGKAAWLNFRSTEI